MPELIRSSVWQFRAFNEWVKQVLITGLTATGSCAVLHASSSGDFSDTGKLARAKGVSRVTFVVPDEASRVAGEQKWAEKTSGGASDTAAQFAVAPVTGLAQARLANYDCALLFDGLASAWSSETSANAVIEQLAQSVAVGGLVAGIVPDAAQIWSLAQKRAVQNEAKAKKTGAAAVAPSGLIESSLFSISFECGTLDGFFPFGTKYALRLDDGQVEEQFVVHSKTLLRLLKAHGLQLTDYSNYLEFFEDHKRNHYEDLRRLGVLSSSDGKKKSSTLDPSQVELISLYSTFICRRIL